MLDAPHIEIHWQSVTVIDGDTFKVGDVRYRLQNIDAPELNGRCEAERMLARLAKFYFTQFFFSWTDADITPTATLHGKDQYGRVLVTMTMEGVDVGEAMIEGGFAVRWEGRRASWCLQD